MLVVRNNLQEKQVVKKSSGVGLQNIKQRYGILTDREVFITKTQFRVQCWPTNAHRANFRNGNTAKLYRGETLFKSQGKG